MRNLKRSKITLLFKLFAEHSMLCSFLLFLSLQNNLYQNLMLAAGVLVYYLLYKDNTVFLFIIIVLLVMIPRYHTECVFTGGGKVVEIKENYCVIVDNNKKVLVYTDSFTDFDSIVQYTGTPVLIQSDSGFFRFDFQNYCLSKGIRYACYQSNITLIKDGHSLRNMLQKRCRGKPDQYLLLRVLLGIKSEESGLNGFLKTSGFTLTGFIYLLNILLKYFLYPESCKKISFISAAVLGLIFHFPYILTQYLVFHLFDFTSLSLQQKTGLALLILIVIFPLSVTTASFIIPSVIRCCNALKTQKEYRMLILLAVQSVLFHSINLLQLLLIRFINPVYGLIFILALIEVFTGFGMISWVKYLDTLLSTMSYIDIYGSCAGIGILAYFSMLLYLNHYKYGGWVSIVIFLIFMQFGLFHPCAEVTFINVGQGDSILIREAFNRTNILIDTGKPSSLNAVQDFLRAKSIHNIEGLIISHQDSDHSGNSDYIIQNYHPEQIIINHQTEYKIGSIQFLDLNQIINNDENQSSIVSLFKLNGLTYLMMGDSDTIAERSIVQTYDLDCNVLKISHHGSKNGTTDELLQMCDPDLAVISCGRQNTYNHPHPDTIQRLLKNHIPFLTTKEEGDISIICLFHLNILISSSGKIGIIST